MNDHTETVVDRLPDCDWPECHLAACYEAKTTAGPWAYVCDRHFAAECYGLGLGLGQRLILRGSKAEEASER